MSKQLTKNHRVILIIMAMSFIPFGIAWVMTKNPHWFSSRTNNGELIIPPVITERNELNGRWVMINIIPGDSCNEVCLQAMYKTRQLRLMMGKELTRIRRVVLLYNQTQPEEVINWWKNDDRLLRATPVHSLKEKIKQLTKNEIPDGMLLIMDPFGNIMMQYNPGFDPYAVKSDLKKLLRHSQIG